MKERTFTFYFEGNKFEGIGNLLGGWIKKTNAIDYEKPLLKTNYKDFYKIAKKNHISVDAYKINDSEDLYILCGSPIGTFYKIKDVENLKLCEEYERWYQ